MGFRLMNKYYLKLDSKKRNEYKKFFVKDALVVVHFARGGSVWVFEAERNIDQARSYWSQLISCGWKRHNGNL